MVRSFKGQSKKRFFAPTSNLSLRLSRNPATKKYQVVTYRVFARALCQSNNRTWKQAAFKEKRISEELSVCDKTPTPPFDTKDKKNRYPKFFGLMQKVTLEFAFGWHMTWPEETGTIYEI